MAILSFDDLSAALLSQVISGASSKGAESLLMFTCRGDGTATVSTNVPFARSMDMECEGVDPDELVYATIYAHAISGVASKVEEGETLSINIKDDALYVATGTTTITLSNLSDDAPEVEHIKTPIVLETVGAGDFIGALSTAATLSTPGDGYVEISSDSQQSVVGVRSSVIHSQEVFPSSLVGEDSYSVRIEGKQLSPLKSVFATGAVDTMKISQGQGAVSFKFPVDVPGVSATSICVTLPTTVGVKEVAETPCDEDVRECALVDKKDLSQAVRPLVPIVGKGGTVILDTNAENGVHVSMSHENDKATTVVINATVVNTEKLEVSTAQLFAALRSISTPIVVCGLIENSDGSWMSMSPTHDDDADTGDDIVIAIPLHT